MASYGWVLLLAVAAGVLSGVVGTGSSLLLLPVLVQSYGPKAAVPIMATAAIVGNLARAAVWWRQVDWRAAGSYALAGVPAAALGAHTLLGLRARVIDLYLGLFFLAMIPARRYLARAQWRLSLPQLGLCGAGIGFLTGLVLSTGPVSVPAFLAYGLGGGALLGTEAASAVLLYVGKAGTFAAQGALPWPILLQGLLVGAGIMAGTACSKTLVLKLPPAVMRGLIDLMLFLSGAALLASVFR
jgi:uncharacterized membrane protein YfcA